MNLTTAVGDNCCPRLRMLNTAVRELMGRGAHGAKVGVVEAPCARRMSSQRASSWARLRGSVTARLMCVLKGGVHVLGVAGLGWTDLCDASHGEAGDSLPPQAAQPLSGHNL